jgi:hypothetical protein
MAGERAGVLLGQLRELLAAAELGEFPNSAAYRHRVEGGVTALEAVLCLPPSLGSGVSDIPG